jgi:hypothetical protein
MRSNRVIIQEEAEFFKRIEEPAVVEIVNATKKMNEEEVNSLSDEKLVKFLRFWSGIAKYDEHFGPDDYPTSFFNANLLEREVLERLKKRANPR